MLGDADTHWRLQVIETIGQLRSAAHPAQDDLVILLDDGEADVRVTALEAISHLGLEPKVMLPTLVKTLHDEDAEVRCRRSDDCTTFGNGREP